MQQLEDQLNEVFTKSIPYQLPDHARSAIVKFMPWVTLAGGFLTFFAALASYMAMNVANNVYNLPYPYGYSMHAYVSPLLWIFILILLAETVLFVAAFPALRDHKRKGWLIVYWVSLVYAVYGVTHLFDNFDLGGFVSSLISSAVGLYILFQIRGYYTDAGAPAQVKPASPNDKKEVPVAEPKDKPQA